MKYVIVGTSHAGFEAVQTLLKKDSDAEIVVFEAGSTASFLSCGIQSYLEDIAKSLDELHYANEASYKEQGVDIRMNTSVIAINPDTKEITTRTTDGVEATESYDKLLLSPGGVPGKIPNVDDQHENIFYLRGRNWADKVKNRMSSAKKAVVVGAGYIGIEAAIAYAQAGIDVTVVDFVDSILPTYLDSEFTSLLTKHMEEKGMKIKTGEGVKEFKVNENNEVTAVVTDKGTYEADTVIISVGVRPNTQWLKDTLTLDGRGFVEVNEHMETSVKDVYAAGDATAIPFAPTNDKAYIALATNARRQGVIMARHASGDADAKIGRVNGTSGLAVFDYKFATTGIKDANANSYQGNVKSVYKEDLIRPSFMHDEEKVLMKLHYDADNGRILGAQLMSTYDILQAINAVSVAIEAEWTVDQLAQADFFFQPEFSRPWNFLNVLAQEAQGQPYGADTMIF
ncbi:NADH peroxidase [Aerococcus sp. 150760007-1]|uniref:FAD-dependent oxidoreductase n=1 Tax=Aerococcus urinaeequi TaxID=51665 RepID=A0ABR5ZYU7_9LACT|nr:MULTISPECIES: FAD-dependent oxidoreductase [Lactobacillales]KAF3301958.1 FAD-dependent oxidoreductase [Carnobacterium sp. PL17RED31]KAF3301774.1 FAD-dependent oxidoreductase [Carnobacterium sp. PL12RED10]KAF3302414.1 FAD-dependent oxidoreductase [Carnobacterium sp. PL26RED25]KAF3306116.1 FAD-dependent oxidoreductase [Carnobacterium sp. PL24RED07]MBA5746922.1 FAD-dependent oxidoreductase [Aerococcus urinaeequi]